MSSTRAAESPLARMTLTAASRSFALDSCSASVMGTYQSVRAIPTRRYDVKWQRLLGSIRADLIRESIRYGIAEQRARRIPGAQPPPCESTLPTARGGTFKVK